MFTPTSEQLAIVAAAVETTDNLQIQAYAGAAKTSTLVLIANALPETRILCLAFNKKIATEMQDRLPANCTAMTLNSLGHRAWGETLGRRLRVEGDKNYNIISELANKLPKHEKEAVFESFSDYTKLLSQAKQAGYIPDGFGRSAKPLMGDDDFFESLDEALESWEIELVREAMIMYLNLAFGGTIDFDDQILMPTVFPSPFPRYPLVLIDEAQDLSALNHRMLKKLVVKRIIAVGDECQAIYAFRGASQKSMRELRDQFNMRQLFLTITFRCPVEIVKHAQWRAPNMKWGPSAPAGEVATLSSWDMESIPESAAIICRNNAPLFSLAIKMLTQGRYAELYGNDIGKGLLKIMKKFGKMDTAQAAVLKSIAQWEAEKLAKTRKPDNVRDRAECLRIFARQGATLGDAIAYAEHVFEASGPVKLMTGHKSKGLEFDTVFILDKHLLRDEGQDRNLLYVMQTRAKQSLTYIATEDFIPVRYAEE